MTIYYLLLNIERQTTNNKLPAIDKNTLVVKFKIEGNLRFLSHKETVRVFQRALARAGIKVCYSEGFNPHPRLSLPFPRSVGLESDDELACVLIAGGQSGQCGSTPAKEIKAQLGKELPCGCELVSVEIVNGRTRFRPASATYVFTLGDEVKAEITADGTERFAEILRRSGLDYPADGSKVKRTAVKWQ